MNQRPGDYWRECAANQHLSDPLKGMITAWYTHQDIAAANHELYGDTPAYPALSWHCLFAGYGTFPSPEKVLPLPTQFAAADAARSAALVEACAQNFSVG